MKIESSEVLKMIERYRMLESITTSILNCVTDSKYNLWYDKCSEVCGSKNDEYSKIVTAIDVIDDCNDAIIEYLEIEEDSTNKRLLLPLYGLLQVIYIQQDVIKCLVEIVIGEKIEVKNIPIRIVRNKVFGHPISKYNDVNKFHFIDKGTHDKWTFNFATQTNMHKLKYDRKHNKKEAYIARPVKLKEELDNHYSFLHTYLIQIEANIESFLDKETNKILGGKFENSVGKHTKN